MPDKNVSIESETSAVSRNDLDGTCAIDVAGERRYHGVKNVEYPLPNDNEEHKRLEDMQLVFRILVGGNVVAPISEHPTQILDVGTGGGAWVIEVAKEYPQALVYGLDISPINRPDAPKNCKFVQGDLNQGLKFEDKSMDLVHSRAIMASQTKAQWPGYMNEVYRILKQDGWIQCVEFEPFYKCDDGTVPEGAALWKFQKYTKDLFENQKGFLLHGKHLEQNMKDAGFVDVKARVVRIDFGELTADPKIGPRPVYNSFAGTVGPLMGCMAPVMPDGKARTEYAKQIVEEMTDPNHSLYTTAHVVVGRKPDTYEKGNK